MLETARIRLLVALGVCMFASASNAVAQFASPKVDLEAVSRGAKIYAQSCAKCHGIGARGTQTAPDLIRSLPVLHDRLNSLHGKELAPLLSKEPTHSFKLDQSQVADLAQFLTQSVNKVLRSGYSNQPTHLLDGDAKAGAAYFNGAGGCNKCHSTSGDLAGVGKKYDPATLQQKFLFPSAAGRGPRTGPAPKRPQATITLRSGEKIAGTLVKIDDFVVSIRGEDGTQRSFNRTYGVTVKVDDPFEGHNKLLDKYTDTDIYNMTTYLETLK